MGNVSLLGYIFTAFLILPFPLHLYLLYRFIKKNGVKRFALCVFSLFMIIVVSTQFKYFKRNQFYYEMKKEFQNIESIKMFREPNSDEIYIHLKNNPELLDIVEEISLAIFSEVLNGNNSVYYDNLLRNPSWFEISYGNRNGVTIRFTINRKSVLKLQLEDDDGSYFFIGNFNDEVIKISIPPN